MIDDTNLAIVRAALTFWDEEMASADRSVYKHYLHSSDSRKTLTAEDVARTRQYFNSVEIRIGTADPNTGKIELVSPSTVVGQSKKGMPENVVVLVQRKTYD